MQYKQQETKHMRQPQITWRIYLTFRPKERCFLYENALTDNMFLLRTQYSVEAETLPSNTEHAHNYTDYPAKKYKEQRDQRFRFQS